MCNEKLKFGAVFYDDDDVDAALVMASLCVCVCVTERDYCACVCMRCAMRECKVPLHNATTEQL